MSEFNPVKAAETLARFVTMLKGVPGVNWDSLSFAVPVAHTYGRLRAAELRPDGFFLHFDDVSAHFGHEDVTADKINEVIEDHDKVKSAMASMIKEGQVFLTNISSDRLDQLLKTWSDAFGEDNPSLFLHPSGVNCFTGYVRTNLTPRQIAAMMNEDGDDNYTPTPMFDD